MKRADRAPELSPRSSRCSPRPRTARRRRSTALLDFAQRAGASDNVLLVHAVTPDAQHRATQGLRRAARAADLSVPDESARRERLAALGLERAIDREVLVEPEVFELLSGRGRLAARPFLSDLDRLIDSAAGPRVTAEEAARQIADESREYGSDFVEAVAGRDLEQALRLLAKLLSGASFTAFRPVGREGGRAFGREEGPARRGRVLPAPGPSRGRASGGCSRFARPWTSVRVAFGGRARAGLPRIRGPGPPRAQGGPRRVSRRFLSTRTRSFSTRRTSRPSAGRRRTSGARSWGWRRSTAA